MPLRLRYCCCGCSLKEGTIVVGVLFIVLTIAVLICDIYYIIRYSADYDGKKNTWYAHAEVIILPILIITLVSCISQIVTSSLLLRGVIKYDRRLVMPWLVLNAVLCGLLFLCVIGGAITTFIITAAHISGDLTTVAIGFIVLVLGAVIVGTYVYFLLVVYSFYSLLPMMSSERIAILLKRFKNPYMQHDDESSHISKDNWSNIDSTPYFSGY